MAQQVGQAVIAKDSQALIPILLCSRSQYIREANIPQHPLQRRPADDALGSRCRSRPSAAIVALLDCKP